MKCLKNKFQLNFSDQIVVMVDFVVVAVVVVVFPIKYQIFQLVFHR
jgi:hypothetical protein